MYEFKNDKLYLYNLYLYLYLCLGKTPGIGVHFYTLSTWEAEDWQLEANLGYSVGHYLKTKQRVLSNNIFLKIFCFMSTK
jgi:hypothetical protein